MSATYAPPAAPTSRSWVAPALLAVPVVWCAVLLILMRPDALEARESIPFEIKWLVYDESDLGAMVVRGANAHMGRLPGRPDEPDWTEPEDIAAALDAPREPFADRYYLEYPTPTLVLFRLGFLLVPRGEEVAPPAVADAHHYGTAHHVPRDDAERRIWSRLRAGAIAIVVVMTLSLSAMILVLRRGYEPGDPVPWTWLAVLPGAVFFSLNRFDVLPAFLTAAGFALLGRRRDAWSGAAFGVAALLKIYPVLLAPVILRHLGARRGAAWLVGFAGMGLIGLGASVATLGRDATRGPIDVQLSREYVENSWTLYEAILPIELANEENRSTRLAILAAVVLAAAATRPAGLPGVLRRCAVVLVAFVVLAVFWSPQWIVWFLPLLAPLAPRRWWVGGAAVLLDLVNYFNFPILFWIIVNRMDDRDAFDTIAGAMIWLRGLLWLGLGAGLVYDECRAKWAVRRARVTSPAATGR